MREFVCSACVCWALMCQHAVVISVYLRCHDPLASVYIFLFLGRLGLIRIQLLLFRVFPCCGGKLECCVTLSHPLLHHKLVCNIV